MFRGITTQSSKTWGRLRLCCLPPKKGEKMEGFVKREDSTGLAQSEPKTAEEINLIHKIETHTKNLIQSINSIESLTNRLNKNLLPQKPKGESKAGLDQRPPQGWLECHLTDLEHSLRRCGQIYDEVQRLLQATQTDKVGQ